MIYGPQSYDSMFGEKMLNLRLNCAQVQVTEFIPLKLVVAS
jgi:hypothetical protein